VAVVAEGQCSPLSSDPCKNNPDPEELGSEAVAQMLWDRNNFIDRIGNWLRLGDLRIDVPLQALEL
jgi:hypothetical protein